MPGLLYGGVDLAKRRKSRKLQLFGELTGLIHNVDQIVPGHALPFPGIIVDIPGLLCRHNLLVAPSDPLNKLEVISNKFGVDFVLSVSQDEGDLPESLREKVIVSTIFPDTFCTSVFTLSNKCFVFPFPFLPTIN